MYQVWGCVTVLGSLFSIEYAQIQFVFPTLPLNTHTLTLNMLTLNSYLIRTLEPVIMFLTITLKIESLAGGGFRGYKLSRTPTFKFKFGGD